MTGTDLSAIEEISVSAELTESGIKAGAKSRALVAVDRLLGSTVDLIGVPIEGLRERMRARNALRVEIIAKQGALGLENLGHDDSTASAVLEAHSKEQSRKIENKEAIAIEFLEELKNNPDSSDECDLNLDADWINIFSSHAENASSDHLRTLWAQILAGEVRKPGAFSLSTLRFVSELDKEIADLFQKYLGSIVRDQFLIKPKDLSGQVLIDLTNLEEAGLLSEVNGSLGFPFKPNDSGYSFEAKGNLLLAMKHTNEFRLDVIKITRIGREIASILPVKSDEEVILDVFNVLNDQIEEATINMIVNRLPDGRIQHIPTKKLK